jgi:transposase
VKSSSVDKDARVRELESALAAERAALTAERAAHQAVAVAYRESQAAHQATLDDYALLKQAYEAARTELALIKHRLFVAKAERVDTTQLRLEFAGVLARANALAHQLGDLVGDSGLADAKGGGAGDSAAPARSHRGEGATSTSKPTGRRDLRDLPLPEERIELLDPSAEGVLPRCGWEERSELRWRRASMVRVIVARAKYQAPHTTEDGNTVHTAELPPSLIPRSIAGPSVWAALISQKLLEGMPYHRQEDKLARAGVTIDRGTMSRWQEHLGATVGATVVEAARRHALSTAFAIATDATGVLVQPVASNDQTRQPCRRGHYFVQIADADHVFFEYTPSEDSVAVQRMFAGFSGHVIADAKSVYDVLYRPAGAQAALVLDAPWVREPDTGNETDHETVDATASVETCTEVACWAHARRHMWEGAVISKDPRAREGLARIMQLFELERRWKKLSKAELLQSRKTQAAPLVEDLFEWAKSIWNEVAAQRGLVRTAFGYLRNQQMALRRYLDDGRLPMTNNHSERELRRIAVGRKAWLFVGSDDHAQAAGNLLSLIATARLHGLDPEQYLADLFRVLPQWPRERHLELWPAFWRATRATLRDDELNQPVGWLTIPPLPSA